MVSWFENLSDESTIAVSDSGYLNNEIAYEWPKYFEKWTVKRQQALSVGQAD
jgi:hypothetical protein